MAENSGIAWTDHTHNHWIGCQAVSPGCDHCYAEALVKRFNGDFATRKLTSEANRRKPIMWDKRAAKLGIRYRVFCSSLSDVFDNQVPADWRASLWELIRATPNLDWQLLTKRPQNIAKMLPVDWGFGWRNVWLGTTVENQTEAWRRYPHLLSVPAQVHFLSCEPMLSRVFLPAKDTYRHPIGWVICGGESGARFRQIDPEWARDLRDQCSAAGVAFYMKQMSGPSQSRMQPVPDDLMVRQFPA